MAADYALLGLLARRPATGYDLGKWLRTEGLFLGRKASMSPIYRALADLESREWITSTTDRRSGGPDARVYQLTPAGREELLAWADSEFEPAPRPMDPDFIVRLNFAGQIGVDQALRIVRTELEFRVHQRQEEGGPSRGMAGAEPIPEIDPAWLSFVDWVTHERGYSSTSLYIGWLELLERELTLIKTNGGAVRPIFATTTPAETATDQEDA